MLLLLLLILQDWEQLHRILQKLQIKKGVEDLRGGDFLIKIQVASENPDPSVRGWGSFEVRRVTADVKRVSLRAPRLSSR